MNSTGDHLNFESYVGNRRVVDILLKAIGQDRLPHALIFAGPSGVGKRTLALLLAQYLNCLDRQALEPCTRCSSCRKIAAGTHPDVRLIQPDGAFIKIDQVRALIDEIAYQPFEGAYRIAILDGADQMRTEAANCLLKTLEEPPSRSILVLVTSRPYLLLGTIRSRSRMLQFGSIDEAVMADYLVRYRQFAPEDARLAAVLSNGSLGAAESFDAARNQEIRQQALRFITMLLRKASFPEASALAAVLGKDKESFQAWVEMTATLLQDVYYAQTAPVRVGQRDIADELSGLARIVSHPRLVSIIAAVRDLRSALQQNVNRQLALEALFLNETAGQGGTGP